MPSERNQKTQNNQTFRQISCFLLFCSYYFKEHEPSLLEASWTSLWKHIWKHLNHRPSLFFLGIIKFLCPTSRTMEPEGAPRLGLGPSTSWRPRPLRSEYFLKSAPVLRRSLWEICWVNCEGQVASCLWSDIYVHNYGEKKKDAKPIETQDLDLIEISLLNTGARDSWNPPDLWRLFAPIWDISSWVKAGFCSAKAKKLRASAWKTADQQTLFE